MKKKYVIAKEQVKPLVNDSRIAVATLAITVDGQPVGVMYKEKSPIPVDSGWRFYAGSESEEYVDDWGNKEVYCLNAIANIDPAIIRYLNAPYGTYLVRIAGTDRFLQVDGDEIVC